MAARTAESNRRPDIEKFLIDLNVNFTYKQAMRTELIDLEASLRNQARLGVPLNTEAVKRYTEAVYAGDLFPPILVEKRGEAYVVLDGNHRCRAHTDAGARIDAYICEAPSQILVLITFMANAKHGLPSSLEDRIHHALFLHDSGLSAIDAAARLQIPVSEVRKAIQRQAGARRADDAGVLRTHWESLPASSRTRLGAIHTDEGFRAAVRLAMDAGLHSDQVQTLVGSMNSSRSGKRQAAIVAAMRSDLAEQIAEVQVSGLPNRKGSKATAPRTRLASAVGMINALPDVEVYRNEEMPDQVLIDLSKRVDEAIDRLIELRNLWPQA